MHAQIAEEKNENQKIKWELGVFKSQMEAIHCLIIEEKEKNEVERQEYKDEINRKQEEIEHLKNTLSWKITAPLRKIRRLIFKGLTG